MGGATANNTRTPSTHQDVGNVTAPSALDQLAQFLAQHKKTPASPKVSTTLFVINIGINDIYSGGFSITAKEVIDTIFYIVNKLRTYGAMNSAQVIAPLLTKYQEQLTSS